ncbi:TetR family transcriptional regulator [Reyranella sp.]|uniref:TetR family transcriptional regulator n=1 Tax=Reyranella sp. TaxID=1929291 RepID=UPI003BAA2C1A
MPPRKTPRISSRKEPRQARSAQLVSDILEAAVRVLTQDGARRFTTARVAERAGVSVGSLYQYFPNKEAILFRLQADEWKQTGGLLQTMLADRTLPPTERLRAIVRAFFRSEVEEAALRIALADAAPLYRDAPETEAHRKAGRRHVMLFMREALPRATPRERSAAADIMIMSLGAVGAQVSEEARPAAEVERLASAMGDMFAAYLDRLNSA